MIKRLLSIFLISIVTLTMICPAVLAVDSELETDPLPLCTEDEACSAQTHQETCPYDQTRPAEPESESDPEPEPERCTQDAACSAEMHEADCLEFQKLKNDIERSTTDAANLNQILNTNQNQAVELNLADGEIIINAEGYWQGGTYQTHSGPYNLTTDEETKNTVTIESGTHELTLDGVKIEAEDSPAVSIQKGASAAVTLDGENEIIGGACYAGLYVEAGAEVTIDGTGSLRAQGGMVENKNVGTGAGAGIGGNGAQIEDRQVLEWCDFGSITIKGGTVNAAGGATKTGNYGAGAGIGGGGSTLAQGSIEGIAELKGSILIENGTIMAIGGDDSNSDSWGGAGIGSGGAGDTNQPHGSDIKVMINGGTITAKGGSLAAGIGGSNSIDGGRITITGGQVEAIGGMDGYWGGAGIGGGDNGGVKEIKIAGNAQVMAKGGGCAAGIGGGTDRGVDIIQDDATVKEGSITIGGSAVVTAYGSGNGSFGGAGIGAGNSYYNDNGCGAISILDSAKVTAFAGTKAQGIGVGSNYAGDFKNRLVVGGSGVQVWLFNRDTAWPAFWGQSETGDGITDAYTGNGVTTVWYTNDEVPNVDILSDAHSTAPGKSYQWSYNAAREITILSNTEEVQKGTYPAGFTLGNWAAIFPADTHKVTAGVSGRGGTVSPVSQSVAQGGDAVFTITREPGYKVSAVKVTVDGVETDAIGNLKNGVLTLPDIQADAAVTVTFGKMTMEDVKDAADQLPSIEPGTPPEPEEQQTILDTKMDYEALSEAEKEALSAAQKEKLHEALSQLPNVEVQVDVQIVGDGQAVFSVPEDQKPALLENMTLDEAAALKAGGAAAYKIVVTVAEAKPDESAETSIHGMLNGALAAEKHDVTVKKVLVKSEAEAAEEYINDLAKPIQLVFSIPKSLRNPPADTVRAFTMLRTHQNDVGGYDTERLDGMLDTERWTYTVESDRFSTYTLAYMDTETPGRNLSIVPSTAILQGGGTVTLTVAGVPSGGSARVSCDDKSIVITPNADGTFFVALPNSTRTYTFTVSYGDGVETAVCTVQVAGSGSSGSSSGGSGGYTVSVGSSENGSVRVSPANASKGATVTVTVQPDAGYLLGGLTVTDSRGNELKVTGRGGGVFTFIMPGSKVAVQASFVPDDTAEYGLPFLDVNRGDWFYEAVAYVYREGLMSGTSGTAFSPNAATTRGMIVTILHRLEGAPAAAAAAFDDVADGQYYTKAVAWAAANGIVEGYGDGSFRPSVPITREQLAAILYRYARYRGYDVSGANALSGFQDAASVSGYAAGAMSWAVERDLIGGMGDGTLQPQGGATRAQAAAILYRYLTAGGQPETPDTPGISTEGIAKHLKPF